MRWRYRKLIVCVCERSIVEDALQGTICLDNAGRVLHANLRIAAALIMNDDVDGAEDGLSEGNSSFHNVRVIVGCLWLEIWIPLLFVISGLIVR